MTEKDTTQQELERELGKQQYRIWSNLLQFRGWVGDDRSPMTHEPSGVPLAERELIYQVDHMTDPESKVSHEQVEVYIPKDPEDFGLERIPNGLIDDEKWIYFYITPLDPYRLIARKYEEDDLHAEVEELNVVISSEGRAFEAVSIASVLQKEYLHWHMDNTNSDTPVLKVDPDMVLPESEWVDQYKQPLSWIPLSGATLERLMILARNVGLNQ